MRQNMSGWSQAECDELKKAGIADEILYYHRALGKKKSIQPMCLLHSTLRRSS